MSVVVDLTGAALVRAKREIERLEDEREDAILLLARLNVEYYAALEAWSSLEEYSKQRPRRSRAVGLGLRSTGTSSSHRGFPRTGHSLGRDIDV